MNQLFGLQHRNRVFDLKVRSVACAIRCALKIPTITLMSQDILLLSSRGASMP